MTRKILVFSDSHKQTEYLNKALALNADADMIVHLGDGASDLTLRLPDEHRTPIVAIEGNGEYYGTMRIDRRYLPKKEVMLEFEGKRIFMTHGHLYDVKYGLGRIISHACAEGADIVLFGHTHMPLSEYLPLGTQLEGIGELPRPMWLFNPGSIGVGIKHSFGIITFCGGEPLLSHGAI